jgi:single-strand DNA-binding protein
MTIVGNMARDPETSYTPNGKMKITFTVAVNKRKQGDGANFFRVTAWGKLAEILDTLATQGALVKGRQVFAAGSFEAREYQANDGSTKMSLDLNASDVQLLGSRDAVDAPADLDSVPF